MGPTGQIAVSLFLAHEHIDDLFGLQAVLELKRDITIYIPSTFHAEAERFIAGGVFPEAHAANAVPHTGELVRLEPGGGTVCVNSKKRFRAKSLTRFGSDRSRLNEGQLCGLC
jgi:hypothetical protein